MGKRIVVILLIVGLLASGYVAVQRYRTEAKNKAVEMVVDWDEVQQIAAATRVTPADVLKRFKAAGVTGVAVSEATLRDAIDDGEATQPRPGLLQFDPRVRDRACSYLEGLGLATDLSFLHPPLFIGPGAHMHDFLQTPIGLPEDALAWAKAAGLDVVARLTSYPGATPKAINFMMADAKRQGASTIVFQGDTVLGFKGAVKETADALRANGLYFGRIEFSKQKGDEELADKAKDRVLIVHSITQAEMPTLNQPSIVDRFEKGVRERGVRMCYIRMYNTASSDLIGSNADYIAEIGKAIRKAGYTLTPTHLLGEVKVPRAVWAIVGIGVAAGVILLIGSIVELPGALLPIILIVICAGLAASGETGRKAVALLSALTFPTLAAILAVRNVPEEATAVPGALWSAIKRLLWAVVTTAAGGLLIVGLLSQRDFMLRTDQFMGVKLAHVFPVLALTLLFAGQIAWKSDKWAAQKERFCKSLRAMASNPVLIWQAIGMIAALAIVGVMVARSGNDAGVGVSSVELRFRSILDKVLYVRPRTKEFLIGYPALLAGIAFAVRGRRQWAAPLVVVGSIGLISALNTFCHIHTPLQLSLFRVFNGAVVGILVGSVVYCMIKWLPGKES